MRKIHRYISRIMAAVIALSLLPSFSILASTEVIRVPEAEYKNYRQTFQYVDIKPYANRGFADDVAGDGVGGWADQGPTNDMACFRERGITDFAGVKFDIVNPNSNDGKSAIVLRGQNDETVPTSAEIDVNAKAQGVYILHAAPWLNDSNDEVGSYTFVYADGTELETKVHANLQVFNWWNGGKSDYAYTAWTGQNPSSKVALTLFPIANPYPDKEINKIVAKTVGSTAYICIAGITLTDSGPYLHIPEKKTIGNPDTSDWYPYVYCEEPDEIEGTPLDMSYLLDAPAGKHGYIEAEGENVKFQDGTDARFWGLVLAGPASMFISHGDAEKAAKRIAQMGFNSVRFHGMANIWDSNKESSNSSIRRGGGLSAENMEKLCYFLKQLSDNGIYYGFDLMTSGDLWKNNNVRDFEKMDHLTRGPNYFDEAVIKDINKRAEDLLTYKNPYTGKTIGEDPALIFCALENETSIFFATNFDQWDYYYPKMNALYNSWLLEKYPTRNALNTAWTEPESNNVGLYPEEDQTKGTVKLRPMPNLRDINNKRIKDNIAFLAYLQSKSMNARFAEVRKWAPHALLQASTAFTAGYGDRANQYTLAKNGDFYSMQAYFFLAIGNGEHLVAGTKTISEPESILASPALNNMGLFASCKVFGRPYFQTEWDNGMPNPYRSEITLMMGAFTAFQNWNPYLFCWDPSCVYSTRVRKTESEKTPLNQHSLMDRPDMINVLPIIAQMVLRGDIKAAEEGYFFNRYQNGEMYEGNVQGMVGDSAWAWCGKSGYFIDDVEYDADYNNNDIFKLKLHGDKTGKYIAYTDEMLTDVKSGRYLLNTDRTQAAAGKIGKAELNDVIFDIKNPFATVYLTSREEDKTSIKDADRLLLTMVGDSRMIGQTMTDDSIEFLTPGEGPMILEPIKGTVTIKNCNSYDVYTIGADGQRNKKIPTEKTKEGYTIFKTTSEDETINYELIRTAKKPGAAPEKISFLDESIYDDMFTDLGNWDKDKIERIYMQGFIKPTGDKRISPDQVLTRAEAAKAIIDAFGFSSEKAPAFMDVDSAYQYYKYICSAAEYGIIVGDENKNFRPDDPITRQDFVLMVKKALDKSDKKRTADRVETPKMNFDEISGYARSAAEEMVKLGYIENAVSLRPRAYATRGELCIILYNILWE